MKPPRVVSLLPSATETLCAIGGITRLVGRSHECDFPHWIEPLPVLTAARTHFQNPGDSAAIDAQVCDSLAGGQSLYVVDEERLAALKPDVILTQDLCRVCSIDLATVQRLAATLSPQPLVVSLNPTTLEDVLDDVLRVGEAVGLLAEAKAALTRLRERLYGAADFVNPYDDGPSVALLEWTDPLFCAGHWTPQLIERAGGRHPLNPTVPMEGAGAAAGPIGVTQRTAGPSFRITPEQLIASRPEAIVIAPCGLTLAQTREEASRLASQTWWHELPAVKAGRVALVDGNQFFNRPGPRLVDAFEFLVGWLQDRRDLIPASFAWEPMS